MATESEKRYQKLIETMHEFVAELLPDGTFRHVNKILAEDSGYRPEELVGTNFFSYIHPEDTPETLHHCENLIKKRMSIRNCEYRFRNKEGSYIHVITNGEPLTDSEGHLEAILQVSFNITKQKETEAALRESEKRFRNIFDHSNDAIFVIDPQRDKILEISPKACDMLGYTKEELLSKHISDIHPDEMFELQAFAQLVFEEGEGYTDKLTCRRKDGQVIPASLNASVIELQERACILAMTRDITDRKRAEEITRQYSEKLEQEVKKRTSDLQKKNDELQRFNKLFVGRELRIKELKEKVKALEKERGV